MGARLVAVVATACLFSACGPAGGGRPSPTSAVSPAAASAAALTPFFGSYSMADRDIVVIARLGWFFDVGSADYRTIYATGSPDRFTIGAAFQEPLPKFAELSFSGPRLTIREAHRTRVGELIAYKHTDISIPAGGAVLAATITEPTRPGPYPGIVVVHGAEPGQRHFYDVWVGVYASLGLAVLTYDKRGVGASTGSYPGESPTSAALSTYAADAEAAREFLARWPGVEPRRVGFHGGSQAGWTVPLAMATHPGAAFAVLASAPATDVVQTDLWASFSNNGAEKPSQTADEMLAAVRATHGGYDPAPALQAVTAPVLWVLGTNDRTVPTAVGIQVLDSLHKSNFTVQQVPTGHGLLVNPTGLDADDARSPGLAPQLVPALRGWLGKVLAF